MKKPTTRALTDPSSSTSPEAFIRRALASLARTKAAGDAMPAEQVMARLQARLDAARARTRQTRG